MDPATLSIVSAVGGIVSAGAGVGKLLAGSPKAPAPIAPPAPPPAANPASTANPTVAAAAASAQRARAAAAITQGAAASAAGSMGLDQTGATPGLKAQ